MKNNQVYIAIIIVLIAIITILVILLFIGDSGKYCTPIIKEKLNFPQQKLNADSIYYEDSLKKIINNK